MAFTAVKKNGSVLLSPAPECGIMVQPSRAATGYEVVQVRHDLPVLMNGLSWMHSAAKSTAKWSKNPH